MKNLVLSVTAAATVALGSFHLADAAVTRHVTVNADAGAGSLRQAIADSAAGDIIDFAVTGTITLASALNVTKNLTVQGPGARRLTVLTNGPATTQVFKLSSGAVFLSGLTIGGAGQSGGITGVQITGANVTMNDCTITQNTGNGVVVQTAGVLAMTRCTISGNHDDTTGFGPALSGGGMYSAGAVTMKNCTVSGNVCSPTNPMASGAGGGIFWANGTINLTNCTITNNHAQGNTGAAGGGLTGNASAVTLVNTIVAGNTTTGNQGSPGDGPDVSGGFFSSGNNLIGIKDGSTGFTDGVKHDKVGTMANPLDSGLAALTNNGGATDTAALSVGSPAIDAAATFPAPARDQRNYLRAGSPDIGAEEYGGTIPVNLANISTRLFVGKDDEVSIGGFIVSGPPGSLKKVLIRALGPSLDAFGVPTTLSDPYLELHEANNVIVPNDNWASDPQANQIPQGYAPTDSRESALVVSLAPGNYSAVVHGANGETGNALTEVYDLDTTSAATLGNISTRGLALEDDDVMIGGFFVGGVDSLDVVVRVLGPSLEAFGVKGALPDPTLEVHDGNGNVTMNDDWPQGVNAAKIPPNLRPTDARESVLFMTLAPGQYTAIVHGFGTVHTGVALIEVYAVD